MGVKVRTVTSDGIMNLYSKQCYYAKCTIIVKYLSKHLFCYFMNETLFFHNNKFNLQLCSKHIILRFSYYVAEWISGKFLNVSSNTECNVYILYLCIHTSIFIYFNQKFELNYRTNNYFMFLFAQFIRLSLMSC